MHLFTGQFGVAEWKYTCLDDLFFRPVFPTDYRTQINPQLGRSGYCFVRPLSDDLLGPTESSVWDKSFRIDHWVLEARCNHIGSKWCTENDMLIIDVGGGFASNRMEKGKRRVPPSAKQWTGLAVDVRILLLDKIGWTQVLNIGEQQQLTGVAKTEPRRLERRQFSW